MASYYTKKTIGNESYIFLQLSDVPGSSEISWAKGIIDNNLSSKILIASHNGANDTIKDNILVKRNGIVMLNSGHECSIIHEHMHAPNGKEVQWFQTDYQCDGDGSSTKEAANLRIYKFKPLEDKVVWRTYSPAKKAFDTRDGDANGSFDLSQN